jgi:tRNA nucleotidyltransferase/poly(A) polymerase
MGTAAPTSLAGADWLAAPNVRRLFAVLSGGGEEARIVGGAVRNALLGAPVADVDFGATATPGTVTARAEAAGFKVVPTGIEHGTVTVIAGADSYQVTTLREDIETDGRHAVVRFGRDWEADARRRDFTVNALSVDAEGTVRDPVGGYDDIVAGRIRFIGDADRRIAEDRLRILRFFRLFAEHGRGDIDRDGLSAAVRARAGLRDLSAERVGQEMRRLVVAPRAAETVALMQEVGILPVVLGGVGYPLVFARLAGLDAGVAAAPAPALRLAALACRVEEDVARVARRLRLANAERDRMAAALAAASASAPRPDQRGARRLLYRVGVAAYRDGVALAAAWSGASPDDAGRWRDLLTLPDRWSPPRFPLAGRDIVGAGAPPGPAVGAVLRAVEAWWIERDFAGDEAALKARAHEIMAGQQ